MRYSVNVATAGTYNIDVRIASGNGGGGKFHIEVDCTDVTGQLTVPNTGGWQSYQTVSKSGISFSAGFHLLRLVLDAPGPQAGVGNFNYLSVNLLATGNQPSNLVATTLSSTPSATQVSLTWFAPPSGTVDRYEVERSERINDFFMPLSPNPTSISFTDTSAINGKAYLYRVRAVFSGGALSPYSNTDLATAITFDDDPIIRPNDPQGRPGTTIRAIHLNQLHSAIDAVRYVARLNPAPWKSDPAPLLQGSILAIHYTELRTYLNPALTALSLTTLATDPGIAITQPVMGPHVQDVRDKVK